MLPDMYLATCSTSMHCRQKELSNDMKLIYILYTNCVFCSGCPIFSYMYKRNCFFARYDSSTKESSFSVGLQAVTPGDVDTVKHIIWDTLERVSRYWCIML